ncbi:MAG: HAMP domain-containing protein, partial [Kofleriaceae bacterium]
MTAFRRLRRKLAVAYAVSAVAAILLLETAVLCGIGWHVLFSQAYVDDIVEGAVATRSELASIAAQRDLDRAALSRALEGTFRSWGPAADESIQVTLELGARRSGLVVLLDASGAPRATFACGRSGCSGAAAPAPTPDESARISQALGGATDPAEVALRRADGGVSLAIPLDGPGDAKTDPKTGARIGAMWTRLDPPFTAGSWARASVVFLATTGALVAVLGGVVGLIFGAVVARRLARRLDRIAVAAEAWARGDFDVVAASGDHDDELRDLAERLDAMAAELRSAVALRGALAAAEERSRLARDLHDGVKQQLFATSMLLGAA